MNRGLFVLVALLLSVAAPAHGYLKLGARVGGRTVALKWNRLPVRYFVTDRGVAGVSASQFQAAVARAFERWETIPSSTVTFQFVGFVSALPGTEDGISTLGFAEISEERVLARTSFLIDQLTGEVLESDVEFSTAFAWSVAPAGEAGRYDLESVAAHEIGHLLGLGHSAIGETELRPTGGRRLIAAETAMFPIAFSPGNIEERTLRPDDIAGASDLYPTAAFRTNTGSVSGRVTRNGSGVFGAHVVAFNLRTGTLVGNFTLTTAGEFTIAGLEPGLYLLRVEPLDDGDVESFLQESRDVDLNFRVAFSSRLVGVPRGGAPDPIDIEVVPK